MDRKELLESSLDPELVMGSLMQDIDALRRELEDVNQRLASLERRRTELLELLEATTKVVRAKATLFHRPLPGLDLAALTTPNFAGLGFADSAFRVLSDSDRPLHVEELWGQLDSGGIKSDARNPSASLSTILKEDTRFAQLKKGKRVFDLAFRSTSTKPEVGERGASVEPMSETRR